MSHSKDPSSDEAREIWVIVIVVSPAKKSAVVPGPGMAPVSNALSWTHVMASIISGEASSQVV